jgi:uncharacterized protein YeaO (DUF488 family)
MASINETKRESSGSDLAALSEGSAGIRVKRTYAPPERADGRRILVERLWPRGMKKEALAADAWMKEVAPSTQLRTWFGHRTERWEEFRRRYRAELDANPAGWAPLLEAGRRGPVTLLYSARDTLHNGALVLRDYLAERLAERAISRGTRPHRHTATPTEAPSRGPRPVARRGQTRRPVRTRASASRGRPARCRSSSAASASADPS